MQESAWPILHPETSFFPPHKAKAMFLITASLKVLVKSLQATLKLNSDNRPLITAVKPAGLLSAL